jgi:hypothetical protein
LGGGTSKLRTKAELVAALLSAEAKISAAEPPAGHAPLVRKAKPTPKPAAEAEEAEAEAKAPAQPEAPPQPGQDAGRHYEEHLGELPERYLDDSFVALPIGPEALFFFWDFKPDTEEVARAGLLKPRAVLTLYSGGHAVEHIDFALESRSYYVRSLSPGKTYEAEIFFVGENGERRRVGPSSNAVTLPPRGISPIVDDRFIRFLWSTPLGTVQYPQVTAPAGTVHGTGAGAIGSSPVGYGNPATPQTNPIR